MNEPVQPYLQQFRGSFTSTMRWPDLDELWRRLSESPHGWYIYAVGQDLPTSPAPEGDFLRFLVEIRALLESEHEQDYCGIVYADDLQAPGMVKIYDPNNLGVSCGYSDNPPLPGWVLSRIPPLELEPNQPLPGNRRRWWQRLFA